MGVATSLCCFCLVALLGFGMWQGGMFGAKPPITLDDSINIGGKDYINPNELDNSQTATQSNGKVPGGEKTPNANEGRYKEFLVTEDTRAIMWPWSYLSESERYYEVMLDGIKFTKNSGRTISERFVGEKIGTYTLVGYDNITEEQHTVEAEVYEAESNLIVAITKNNYHPDSN